MRLVEAKKPFVPSLDRKALEALLTATQAGDVLSYAMMSEAIGRDVRACRHLLRSSRRAVRAEHGAVFDPVNGVGLRRLHPNEETTARGARGVKKARRAALEAGKDTRCADYGSLSPAGRAEFNMTLSISGTMLLMTKPGRVKKMQEVWTEKFDPRETMRLFLKK